MKFIKQNKWLLLATAFMVAMSIRMAIVNIDNYGEILWNGKLLLPFIPVLIYALGKNINEFIEEVKNEIRRYSL